ncbi:VWA domain-containing protein (plasmid) [Martelella lutilitoris]|uniref:VWA domain-containing protein n=1 Tax=Martelella lutilitoris TaxID=2583532 RepID=A0A7T7KNG8_9HYPH|nr:VWA domain-containing protein [Martelella lutilitoris]QQM32856.1 VWA domain-containing protein [Martelella lutilitoris]QRX65050.1 VWA domain-containing protein [Dysgonomonadaceae bacterium zrk40]
MRPFAVLLLTLAAACTPSIAVAEDVMVVYDGSGSMWGQIDGVSKVEIARDVMSDLIATWPEGANVGLMAYGHRREADCSDIETLIVPSPPDQPAFISAVNEVTPRGRTPLTESVRQAAELLSYRDTQATVILISDGLETCQADPCALSAELAQQGVNFTAHVVGFDLTEEEHAGLACIAENTGGVFVPAQDADELRDALAHVQNVVDLQPLSPPEPVTEPEPEPEQQADAEIELEVPATVLTGASFTVSWSSAIDPQDYVTIVPVGADDTTYGDYQRVRDETEASLIAPADPGLYEVRYLLDEGTRVLGSAPVEVVEAEVTISAPDEVTTGARFTVSWSSSVHRQDYVTIVPAGADDGSYTNYQRVRDDTENSLTAPAEPGLYEVRYVLDEGSRTLASRPVEVVAAEVALDAPDMARAQSPLRISWSMAIHPQDYITIVSAGADEGTYQDYIRVRTDLEGDMNAPAEPGLYEIRYVLQEGDRTVSSRMLEVVGADAPLDDGVGLVVPVQARPSETITVSWSGGADSADQRVSLARADQADFSWIEAHRIGEETTLELSMPDEPGRYEVRYLDISGQAVLGRAIVEVE